MPALQVEPNKSKLAAATDLAKDFVENVKAVQPKMVFQSDVMKDGRVYKNTLTDWQPQYLPRPDLSEIRTSETY